MSTSPSPSFSAFRPGAYFPEPTLGSTLQLALAHIYVLREYVAIIRTWEMKEKEHRDVHSYIDHILGAALEQLNIVADSLPDGAAGRPVRNPEGKF